MPRSQADIRRELSETISNARREHIIFGITTIVLTPVVLGAAIFALSVFLLGGLSRSRTDPSLVHVCNIYLIFVSILFIVFSKSGARSWLWAGVAIGIGAVIFLIVRSSSLLETQRVLFWILYSILALLMLVAWSRFAAADSDYYERIVRTGTYHWHDAGRRAQAFIFGIGISLMQSIVNSYGEIFGSSWIYRGLTEIETTQAAEVLFALAYQGEGKAAMLLRSYDPRSAGRILEVLARLRIVQPRDGRMELTPQGERLTGISSVL